MCERKDSERGEVVDLKERELIENEKTISFHRYSFITPYVKNFLPFWL